MFGEEGFKEHAPPPYAQALVDARRARIVSIPASRWRRMFAAVVQIKPYSAASFAAARRFGTPSFKFSR